MWYVRLIRDFLTKLIIYFPLFQILEEYYTIQLFLRGYFWH